MKVKKKKEISARKRRNKSTVVKRKNENIKKHMERKQGVER